MHRTAFHMLAPLLVFCRAVSAGETSGGPARDDVAGRALYITHCSACHGANGEGHPGVFPPIKGSRMVTKNDATKHIKVVLNGIQGARAGGVLYSTPMPPFGARLDDIEIAEVIDYERSSFGNHGKLVTAAEVAAQRGASR